jgi:hypothetical protein
MKLFNVIQHDRGTTEGGYLLFEWQTFVPDAIYALGLLADKREAISIRDGLGVWKFFLDMVLGRY